MRVLAIPMVPVLLCSCSTVAGNVPASPAPSDGCDPAAASSYIGRPADPALTDRLLALTGARTARWVAHEGAMTMDYSPDRLNIIVDQQSNIARFTCG